MLLNQVAGSIGSTLTSTTIGLVIPLDQLANLLVTTLAFTALGLILFAFAFWIMNKVAPFSVRKEIEDDQNTALAIVMGSVIIGIALIVAAAVHG
jgi:putative membrane protein